MYDTPTMLCANAYVRDSVVGLQYRPAMRS